jgi:hypothetical protein
VVGLRTDPHRVTLHVRPAEGAPVGAFATVVRVVLSGDVPLVEVPVFGTVASSLEVAPAALVLGAGERSGRVQVRGALILGARCEPAGAFGVALVGSETVEVTRATAKVGTLVVDTKGDESVRIPVRIRE